MKILFRIYTFLKNGFQSFGFLLIIINSIILFIYPVNSQWNIISNKNTDYSYYYNSLFFTSVNTGYISNGDSAIIKTTDGGLNWINLTGTSGYGLQNILFTDSLIGFASGWTAPNSGYLLKTTNSGMNWSVTSFNNAIMGMDFVSPSVGYLLSSENIVYKTINGGLNWITITLSIGNLIDIDFIDQYTGYIASISANKILKTINGGINWAISGVSSPFSIHFIDANTGYYTNVNDYDQTKIFKTTNAAVNWISVFTGNSMFANKPFFIDNNTGWIRGNKKISGVQHRLIMKTTNAGINWYEQSTGIQGDSNSFIGELFMVNNNTGYALSPFNLNGNSTRPTIYKTTNGGEPIGIKPIGNTIPNEYKLYQNYPNPFNPITKIRFAVPNPPLYFPPKEGNVRLVIYNTLGQIIEMQSIASLQPGTYEYEFDGSNYPSGIYYYQLQAGGFIETKKMVLVK